MGIIDYIPYEKRTPDAQYQEALKLILARGKPLPQRQGVNALTFMGVQFHFDLSNGFPLLTERNLAPKIPDKPTIWQQAIGEICAMMNGVTTLQGFEKFGCHWWGPWATEEKCRKRGLQPGHLGDRSYGGAYTAFPAYGNNAKVDQILLVIDQMREHPEYRTHMMTTWSPDDCLKTKYHPEKVTISPCHGSVVHLRVMEGELTLHMVQRSADIVVGVPSNIAQYAALTMMFAHALGLKAREFVHTLSDAHIYVDQIEAVETMLTREPKVFPTMAFNSLTKSKYTHPVAYLRAFRYEHFSLFDYNPHPGIKGIPVAI